MTTEEEQAELDMYGSKILRLEVEILDVSERLKDLKTMKKDNVEIYAGLKRSIERKEKDTTLDDFKGEEGTQDFDLSCPECNSSNITEALTEGNYVCKDCELTFELQGPEEETTDPVCPDCESKDIRKDAETEECICGECGTSFYPETSEDDGEPNPIGEDEEEDGEEEEVQEERIQWLTDVPPNDINFKMNLDNANLATVNKAIEIIDGMPRCKGRLKILNTRKNQLEAEAEKEEDPDDTVQEDSA